MTTIALDADEVLFPFAATYAAWRARRGLKSFDVAALTAYDFSAAVGSPRADDEDTTAFLADPATLAVPPLEGASAAVARLAAAGRVVVVTNRYELGQSGPTSEWLARWLPEVDDVVFARPRAGVPGTAKSEICQALGAAWLVDDTPSHLHGLGPVRGLLFGRYPWQYDAVGLVRAEGWAEALAVLAGPS